MDIQKTIDFAKAMVGSPYVYGGTAKPCTPEYRKQQMKQYPDAAPNIKKHCPVLSGEEDSCLYCKWKGRHCFDCAQLVRFAFRAGGSTLPSGASSQWRCDTAWSLKAKLNPDYARDNFCVLFRRDPLGGRYRPMAHVGLSLGDGYVIDARSSGRVVIMEKLDPKFWTDMAVPTGIQVNMRGDILSFTHALPYGSRGDEVRELQTWLRDIGYPLKRYGIDGIYGQETATAVKEFQSRNGMLATGAADERTLWLIHRNYLDVRYLGMRGA